MAPTKNTSVKKVLPAKSKSARCSIKKEKGKPRQSTVARGTRCSFRLSKRGCAVKTEDEREHPTVKQEDTTNAEQKLSTQEVSTQEVKEEDTKTELTKPVLKEPKYKVSKPTTKVSTKQTRTEKPKGSVKFKSLEIEEAMQDFANRSLKGDLNLAVEAALMVARHAGRKTIQLGDVHLARLFRG